MENYELAVLMKPLLPEDINTKVVSVIDQLVKKLKGTLTEKEVWGKKHLAYPIKGLDEGYYVFFKLELDPAQVAELRRDLKLVPDVLRFLVIKEDQL